MTDPKKARRAFMLLVPLALMTIPVAAWCLTLRYWLLFGVWSVAEASVVAKAKEYYTAGWPGSWLDSCRAFARFRFSRSQQLLGSLIFVIVTLIAQLVLGQGRGELILALIGLVAAVWLFRLMRAIRKEGWRGKKDGTG